MFEEKITNQLISISSANDFSFQSGELTSEWTSKNVGVEAIEPILKFMEINPAIDYGTPGPLVHFIERFYGKGYEDELINSVSRKPTQHTIWMLNRVINGTKESVLKDKFISILNKAKLEIK